MIIQVDSREQKNKEVIEYFEKVGQAYFVSKVAGGDYINFKHPLVTIDLKADLCEVAYNLTIQHDRFLREVKRIKNEMKCDFVVLIREPLESIEAVKQWTGKYTKVSGEVLYKIMQTMAKKYGIHWRFCSREDAGCKIIDILNWYEVKYGSIK